MRKGGDSNNLSYVPHYLPQNENGAAAGAIAVRRSGRYHSSQENERCMLDFKQQRRCEEQLAKMLDLLGGTG